MTSHSHIVNALPINTTQKMPELHLRLSKITPYYVLEAQTDVARFQSKTRLPIRIQEYLSNDVAKMLLAYFAAGGMTEELFYSIDTDNTTVFKLLQRFCRPRDMASFCKLLGEVRFRGDTDLREFIKTYPAYHQALLLYIVDFRQMHDFLAENNTANMPPCNYKPHGSANIFLNHLAREDVQNFMLRHGAKRYDYLSEFLDTMVAYIGHNYEAYNSTVAFMNRFKSIDSVITPSFHPIETRTSYRNAPRVHNLQSAPILAEDHRKQNPADELLEDDQQSHYEPQSVSDDGENEDAQQLPDHTEEYDQELHDYHWQPADNDGDHLHYADAAPRPKTDPATQVCYKYMKTAQCDDPKCPYLHDRKAAQEKLMSQIKSLHASPLALRRPDNVPPQANYRYNPPDRAHSTTAVYNSGPTGAQSRPNPTRPANTGYHAFQTRPTAQHMPRPQFRPKVQLHGKKHQSRLPEQSTTYLKTSCYVMRHIVILAVLYCI